MSSKIEKIWPEIIKSCPPVIKYIDESSEQIKLITVRQNGLAIQYIRNPSEQIQLEAVKQNPESFKYIRNPTKLVVDFYNVLIGKEAE